MPRSGSASNKNSFFETEILFMVRQPFHSLRIFGRLGKAAALPSSIQLYFFAYFLLCENYRQQFPHL
jgi:hypothetical protein